MDVVSEHAAPGPDDLMRLHQVRNFIAGDGWFDMHVWRMLPPDGFDMHWSRLVDLPIAGIIVGFSPFTGSLVAEKIAMIVWPSLLLLGVIFVVSKISEQLVPGVNRWLPMVLTLTCVTCLQQFTFGRLDHHNVQILLFALLLWAAINRQHKWVNVAAGFLVAMSIAVGLDLLVFLVPLIAYYGLEWLAGDDEDGQVMQAFGFGLGGGGLLFFFALVAPDRYFNIACDSHSIVFFAAQMAIAASMLAMAGIGRAIPITPGGSRLLLKLSLAVVFAATTVYLMYSGFPECRGGPMAQLSDQVKQRWLAYVGEARPLSVVLGEEPEQWLATVGFFALVFVAGIGLLATGVAANAAFTILLAAVAVCFFSGFIQYRLIPIGIFAAIPICVVAVDRLIRLASERYGNGGLAFTVKAAIIVLFCSFSWFAAGNWLVSLPPIVSTAVAGTGSGSDQDEIEPLSASCNGQSAYRRLVALPDAIVLDVLNNGPAILVHTNHTAVAGNYHRIETAILDVIDFFKGDDLTARKIARKYAAAYVSYCRRTGADQDAATFSLSKRLRAGDPPPWLSELSTQSDVLALYRVDHDRL